MYVKKGTSDLIVSCIGGLLGGCCESQGGVVDEIFASLGLFLLLARESISISSINFHSF